MRTFKGGIHPRERKDDTKNKPVVVFEAKGNVAIPLSQHIGAPAKALVKKGDEVKVGTLIAEAGGFVSANIHSSVSGTVKGIEKVLTAGGTKVDAIVIENDGKYTEEEFKPNTKDIKDMSKEEILDAIKAAGVVGMGGANFPTNVKLSPKDPSKIDRIIINGSECEPYLTSDYRRMMDEPEKIINGLRIALQIFPGAKGIIAIEDNKKDAAAVISKALGDDPDITVNLMPTKYPEGAERQLIYVNTGRLIDSSKLPADVGCIVHNIDTAHAIYRAVVEGRPLTHRLVTVAGDAIMDPEKVGNYLVPIGMYTKELLDYCGGLDDETKKVIFGGPMMGKASFAPEEVVLTKGSSAILAFLEDEVTDSDKEATNCIRCGKCVTVCPGRVLPAKLSKIAEKGDLETFEKCGGMECCECGCCSYICPAKRPLTQVIAGARKEVLARRRR